MESSTLNQVSDLLYREAAALDEQRWDDWLALFTEDCEYWLPAWKGEHALVADPKTEVSMIYHDRRARLEDRILRIRTGTSAASTPLPRTWHSVTNIRLGEAEGDLLPVHAQWQANTYRFDHTDALYGRYEYRLAQVDGAWRIRRKKIVLINDMINTVLDVYQL
jgi:3-phenylpropionate/cinnamic acid dioxygenase small subunit